MLSNALKWERVMPLSAAIKPSREALDAQATDTHTHSRIHSPLQSIRQHFRHISRSADPPKSNVVAAESQTLQVAVAIAMPSPHKCQHESTLERPTIADFQTHGCHDPNPFEYTLGLMEIPWHSAEA